MSKATSITARVTHRFPQLPEAVFDAWIASDKVRRWFAPGQGQMVRVAIDAREGGMFSFVQRRGMDEVDHVGKYVLFERPNRLSFTWHVKGTADTSKVTVTIESIAEGSVLTLAHELQPHWADYRHRMEASWTNMLTAMAEALR